MSLSDQEDYSLNNLTSIIYCHGVIEVIVNNSIGITNFKNNRHDGNVKMAITKITTIFRWRNDIFE